MPAWKKQGGHQGRLRELTARQVSDTKQRRKGETVGGKHPGVLCNLSQISKATGESSSEGQFRGGLVSQELIYLSVPTCSVLVWKNARETWPCCISNMDMKARQPGPLVNESPVVGGPKVHCCGCIIHHLLTYMVKPGYCFAVSLEISVFTDASSLTYHLFLLWVRFQ